MSDPRRIIVTGGSGGIGSAICDELRRRGAVVLPMQRNGRDGEPYIQLDLRWDREQIRQALESAVDTLGGLDGIVFAGGVGAYMPAYYGRKDISAHVGQIDEQMRTNFSGPAIMFEMAAGHLKREPGEPTSRVLYLGSTIVKQPPKALAYYSASKAAAEAFFRSEARRWAGHGIRINVLATGWVESPMTATIVPKLREKILRAIAVGRMGDPEEAGIAAADLLLGPDYFCGDVVSMSGGL